jgi:hypothetical protein
MKFNAEYKYDKSRGRAQILLYFEGDVIAELTVEEAAKLSTELTGSISDAFYDCTAATPNFASSHHYLNRAGYPYKGNLLK